MREFKLKKWKEIDPDGKEKEVNLINVLSVLINSRDPQKMPRGIDMFRFFNRIGKEFDKAEKEGILKLEEADYTQLKRFVNEDIPAGWGRNKDISEAIDLFLNG